MKTRYTIAFVLGLAASLFAQSSGDGHARRQLGPELQIYPAGLLIGLHYDWRPSARHGFHARLSANVARRRDWGEHPDERGEGFGGGFGYRYHFDPTPEGFFLGIRQDVWYLPIRWLDECIGETPSAGTCLESGTSFTTVLQPTLEMGYQFYWEKEQLSLTPTLSYGLEINVHTKGEAVGQGDILLIGAILARRL